MSRGFTCWAWVLLTCVFGLGCSSPGAPAERAGAAVEAVGSATDLVVSFTLPPTVSPSEPTVAANGELRIDDRVVLNDGIVSTGASSNAGSGSSAYGTDTRVGSVVSAAPVVLRDRATVDGSIRSGSAITRQNDVVVSGRQQQDVDLVPPVEWSWRVAPPAPSQGDVLLQPGQQRSLAPGRYAQVIVKPSAKLTLRSGIYVVDSLQLEPQAELRLDKTSGTIFVYVLASAIYRGAQVDVGGAPGAFLLGYLGAAELALEASLTGAVVSPNAKLLVGPAGGTYVGSFFGKDVEVFPATRVTRRSFDWTPLLGVITGDGGTDLCSVSPMAPRCGARHCSNGVRDWSETDLDCGGECPACNGGHGCASNADCGADLLCGENNGACFGRERAARVCWKPSCAGDERTTSCGQADSACGKTCACIGACDPTRPNDGCPVGEVCKKGLGGLFGSAAPDVCVDPRCPSNDPALCGSPQSLCGSRCVCTPSCASATCANPGDGCGGQCPGACKQGETGCTDDVNCPAGGTCIRDAGGTTTCRPGICAFRILAPPLCGATGAPCGETCPACTPSCEARECGPDPNCGQSCGSCPATSSCSASGQCSSATTPRPILVPDGAGGQRPLDDLPTPPTSPVGALKGMFSVSEQGTSEYLVPIEVPPGRAGMEPLLTLKYAGTRSNEDVGMGWHLEGLSKITRCPRAQALDGYASPIQNDNSDHFCLDGKRLEAVASSATGTVGVYGANGTEYRTLIDSFARVVSRSDPLGGIQLEPWAGVAMAPRSAQGPDSFEVSSKDGRTLFYGRTRDALVLSRNGTRYAWLLNRVLDRSGNTIDIQYTNVAANVPAALSETFPNVVRPRLISYTGHINGDSSPDSVGTREVRFSYEMRGDPQVVFRQGGVPFVAEARLSTIATFVDNVPVKNYRLQYGNRPLSQVERIFECDGASESHCKPPTQFDYRIESGFNPGPAHLNIASAAQLDLNGDGAPDFLTTTVKVNGVDASPTLAAAQIGADVAIGAASAALTPAVGLAVTAVWTIIKGPFWGIFAEDPVVEILRTAQLATGNLAQPLRQVDNVQGLRCEAASPTFLLDYDRDGKDDVVSACGRNAGSLFVARSLGDGHFTSFPADGSPAVTVPINTMGAARGTTAFVGPPPAPILIDVNGDSLQDLVTCRDRATLELRRRLGPDQGFEAVPVRLMATATPPAVASLPLCGEYRPTFNIFDIDGDGTPDLVLRGPRGWLVLRYTETAGVASITWAPVVLPDVNSSQYGAGLSLGDFNGDGLADVWSTQDSRAIIWLNTGDRRFTSRHLFRPQPALQQPIPFTHHRTAVLDFDADGRSDLLENWQSSVSNFNVILIPDSLVQTFDTRDPRLTVPALAGGVRQATFLGAADINGDGVTDLFGDDAGAFYGQGARNTLLTRVVDGLGNTTTVDYDAVDAYTTDARCVGSTWPEKCLHRMTGLVSSYSEGVLSGGSPSGAEIHERTYLYKYLNARMNLTGHGWLGFDHRSVARLGGASTPQQTVSTDYEPVARYDLSGRPTTSATPPYLYPLAGLARTVALDRNNAFEAPLSTLQTKSYGRRIRVDNQWAVRVSADGRPFPFVEARFTDTLDKEELAGGLGAPPPDGEEKLLIHCAQSFASDGYGNLLREREVCQQERNVELALAAAETTLVTRTFAVDRGAWLIANPTTVSVTSSRTSGRQQTQESAFTYDVRGRLQTITRAPNDSNDRRNATSYERDEFGNIIRVTETAPGSAPRVNDISYDAANVFAASTINVRGHTSQLGFDARWGTPTTVVDANGVALQRSYDGFGRLVETRGPLGSTVVSYASSSAQAVDTGVGHIEPRIAVAIEQQGALGTRTGGLVREFDNYGRMVRSRAEGRGGVELVEERAFDVLSRIRGATAPHTASATTVPRDTFAYDHLDRITRIDHADLTFKSFQYASTATLRGDLNAWLGGISCGGLSLGACAVGVTLSTDEEGRRNVAITDHRGLVVRSIDGENIESVAHSSNYIHGAFNRLLFARDNRDLTTGFEYDDYGRRVVHSDPDTGSTVSTYNGFDELTTSTDPKGQQRSYQYDDLGRNVSVVDPAGTTQWIYDQGVNALGRLSETISPATAEAPGGQHVRYAYEATGVAGNRGLVQRVDYVLDDVTYPVTLGYDDLGRTERIAYPNVDGATPVIAKYVYDPSGFLTELDEIGGAASQPLWRVDATFEAHLIERETFGNGASTSYGYNPARRWLDDLQTTLGATPIRSLEYDHEKNGQIATRTASGARREYVYDQLNRLSATLDGPPGVGLSTTYSYDDIGNLVGRGPTVVGFRTEQPHLVATVGDNSYHHDGNGNVDERFGPGIPGGLQLLDYTPFDLPRSIVTGTGASEATTRFDYTANEERVVRRDADRTRYLVGGLYERAASVTGDTLEQRFRLYAGSREIGQIVRNGGTESTLYFHADALGSIDTISRDDGSSFTQAFDPFGQPIDPPSPALTRSGFTGQQHDNELGLIDMKGRIYDPLAGRFMSADPVMQAPFWSQGLNRYSYVFNDPVNNTDPSGFWSQSDGLATTMGGFAGEVALGTAAVAFSGFGAGLGFGGLNVGLSLAMGGYGGGSTGSVTTVIPTAAPAATGVGQGSMNAPSQNQAPAGSQWGSPDAIARPSSLSEDYLAFVPCNRGPGQCNRTTLDIALSLFPVPMAAVEPGVGLLGRALAWLARRFGVQAAEAVPTAVELLVPGGVRIGQAGANASVRVLPGGEPAAQALFQKLAAGGTPHAESYAGSAVSLPGGGFVGIRTIATGSGARAVPAATIDVNIPGIAIRELKFVP